MLQPFTAPATDLTVEGASSFEAAAAAATGEGKKGGSEAELLLLDGAFAYGRCRLEAGTHRLVRISPFDAAVRLLV